MNLISADGISKAYTERWLFKQISFGLARGQKLALVGSNGTGKSTLLKVIAGLIQADDGNLAIGKGVSIGYLPQEPELESGKTIEESLFGSDNPVLNLVKRYEIAILESEFNADEMQFLLEEMDRLDAWDFEKKAHQILAKLGITNLKQKNEALSGGQKKRVALARLLIQSPDVLIFDEPTNHLDLQAIEWLENLLNGHNTSVIMVTHDRYFLDNVATQIMELDRGRLFIHHGNYAFYLEKKSQRDAVELAEVTKARNLMSKELDWMRRMPKARGTKSKSRIEAFYDLKEIANRDLSKNDLEISVQSVRLGNKIIEANHISKSFGEKNIIKDFSYIFKKKDRIGIVGQNGAGKSTLLDILTAKTAPDKGDIVHGQTLKFGYYTQHSSDLDNNNRILEEVRQIADYVTLGNGETITVSKLLDLFLFPPAMQHTPVAKLSGGERRRLQLLKVLVTNPNFLILDEPTNDLDIDTLNVLEDFLMNFDGCLLLVSHDRYFMDKLVDHIFVFEGEGEIRDFYGNYTDYREALEEEEAVSIEKKSNTVPISTKATTTSVQNENKRKLSFKEQREFELLGQEIETLETRKKELEQLLSNGSNNHEELQSWAEEMSKTNEKLDEKGLRWLELSEI
ncbi:MAG: ABC-F family ATP-binding cassette domain-containing protein [Bacteroidia bacterium]|nr:ABC-F family ATP-binding cassette domain-containing protein [Bacteroidia bacterium]